MDIQEKNPHKEVWFDTKEALGLHTLGNQRPRRSCRRYGCVAKLRPQPI
ncbi:MAG: hypothetical protein ACLR6J_19290 [Parabacteroides merdae]